MQALLKRHSKSKYYDPALPEAELHIDHSVKQRNKVSLICAICVKVQLFGASELEDDDEDNIKASGAAPATTDVDADVLSDDEDAWDNLVDDLDDELDALNDNDDDVYVQSIV